MNVKEIRYLVNWQKEYLESALSDCKAVLSGLDQQIADAEQCVQSEHQGRDTVTEVHPGDWIIVGESQLWVCQCEGTLALNDVEIAMCDVCGSRQPDKSPGFQPAPDVR